jgi:hypothetical protein
MSLHDDTDVSWFMAYGAVAAGGSMSVVVSPIREVWEVLYAAAFHDDAGNPGGGYYVDDLVTKIKVGETLASIPLWHRVTLGDQSNLVSPLTLGPGHKLSFETAVGAADGKKLRIEVLKRVLKGVLT